MKEHKEEKGKRECLELIYCFRGHHNINNSMHNNSTLYKTTKVRIFLTGGGGLQRGQPAQKGNGLNCLAC